VIIDCDPGIDDSMALFMALASQAKGELEILAITLVAGNTALDNCARNAMRVLETVGKDSQIPVYRGSKRGLVHDYGKMEVPFHGRDGFNEIDDQGSPPDVSKVKDGAIGAILKIVRENPSQVKVIALGPLTNVAACIVADDEFAPSLAGLELMGGNSRGIGNITSHAEFNFHADPEAAHIVLTRCHLTDDKPIRIVPWETCYHGCYIDWEWRMGILGKLKSKAIGLMNKAEVKWYEKKSFGDQYILCDQLTMAVLIRPKVAAKTILHEGCSVELNGSKTRGMVIIENYKHPSDPTDNLHSNATLLPKVEMVDEIDVEALKDLLIELLG